MDKQIQTVIQPTQKEQELFDFLLNFIKTKDLNVTLRTAGGWVRDKILGKESDDIDFALDTMTGKQFTTLFANYLKEIGKENLASGIGVIKQNPDSSKHLEVATFKIFGYDLDVVNLRCDDYTEHNSNMEEEFKFGTPLEDAQRRDLTINSMFYNVNQGIVEDWTSFGIQDLKNGIIRTPIDPKLTFSDDPLRIFRSFRFAVKYRFSIAPEIIEAIKNQEIKDALLTKVKRQRIRTELEKILIDQNVEIGLDLIYQNDLWTTAFLIADVQEKCQELKDLDFYQMKQRQSYLLTKLSIHELKNVLSTQTLSDQFTYKDAQLLFLMSSLTIPFANIYYKKAKKQIQIPFYLAFESLVFPEKLSNHIQLICDSALVFQKIASNNLEEQFDTIAKLIRNHGSTWELSLILASFFESQLNNNDVLQKYKNLKNFIISNKLENAFEIQILILGKEIMDLFDLNKQGPIIGVIKDRIFLWQARNPEKSKDELVNEIIANKHKFMN